MNLLDDLDILFADSDATMKVGDGESFAILWNEPSEAVQMFEGGVLSSGPVAMVKRADLEANAIDNDVVVNVTSETAGIDNKQYTVNKAMHDGSGLYVLSLTKV